MNTLVAVDELELPNPSTSPGLALQAFTTPCFCRSGGGTQGFMPGCKCSAHRAEPLVLFHWAGISTRYTFQSENLGFLHLLLACKQATLLGGYMPSPPARAFKMQSAILGATKQQSPPSRHSSTETLISQFWEDQGSAISVLLRRKGSACLDLATWLADSCPQLSLCASSSSKDPAHIRV